MRSWSSSSFQPCNALHILKYMISGLCHLLPRNGSFHETSWVSGGFEGHIGLSSTFFSILLPIQLSSLEWVCMSPSPPQSGGPVMPTFSLLLKNPHKGRGPLHPAWAVGWRREYNLKLLTGVCLYGLCFYTLSLIFISILG